MKNFTKVILLSSIIALALFASDQAYVYAADHPTIPDELPVNFRTSDAIIIVLGVLGGLTVALLGKSEASKAPSYKFDARKFARPIIIAVLASVPLAIAASLQFTELNLVTMFMIYAASGFVAELSGRIKRR